jgi:hypothetical protein
MNPASFISGYDADNAATALNTENIKLYVRDEGDGAALSDIAVSFTEDMTTFVFDPTEYLGSATADVTYAVYLDDAIEDADGNTVLDDGGYIWYFTTGTTIDVTPPTILSVTPGNGTTKDRNITVQVTFDEPVDPTSASGIREAASGFSNIQVIGASVGAPTAGTYDISNGYKTVTFTSTDVCGTNSCNETISCLPGAQSVSATVFSATPTSATDPVALVYPYDGIVDTSGNVLDGNGDGSVASNDDYTWSFTTTDDINLDAPAIETITPNIKAEFVPLDQSLVMTFDSLLHTSTINASTITLSNTETYSGDDHELWYAFRTTLLTAANEEVTVPSQVPAKTMITIPHGTFLASDSTSTPPLSYLYGITANEGVLNEYQNCFVPGEGPDASGGSCGTSSSEPYCCQGFPSANVCSLF